MQAPASSTLPDERPIPKAKPSPKPRPESKPEPAPKPVSRAEPDPEPIDPILLEALREWRGRLSLDDLDMTKWLGD